MSNSSFICGYDGESNYQYDNRQGLRHRYSVRWAEAATMKPECNGNRHLVGCIVWTDKRHPPVEELESLHPGYVVAWYKPNGSIRVLETTNGPLEVENRDWHYFGSPKTLIQKRAGRVVARHWAVDCIQHDVYDTSDFTAADLVEA